MDDELGGVKDEIARSAKAVESALFPRLTGIGDERSGVEPRRRLLCESTGTNAPETTFTWADLSGEQPTSVGNQRYH